MGWADLPPFSPSWFSLNNSETVKAVILAFYSSQEHFIRDVRAKFGIPYSTSLQILGKTQMGVFSIFRYLVNPL